MIEDKYYKLCIKAVTGNLINSEELELEKWLLESKNHVDELEKLKAVWSGSAPGDITEDESLEKDWVSLNNRITQYEREEGKIKSFKKRFSFNDAFIPKFKPVFASFIILAGIITGIYFLNKDVPKPRTNVISTLHSGSKDFILPDGSTVFLNRNSKIEFMNEFSGSERKVNLEGEAYFSVTKNPDKPFIIRTSNAKITVVGTKFDVCSRDNRTRLVVSEGKVKFSSIAGNGGLSLTKNQLSIIHKNSGPTLPETIDSDYFLGWMKGKLVFYQTPLTGIADQLKYYYNIEVKIDDDSIKDYSLTGSFNNVSADSALSMICLALGLEYTKQQNSYLIKRKI